MKTSLKFLLALCFLLTLTIYTNAQDAMVLLDESIIEVEPLIQKVETKEKVLTPKEAYLSHTQYATDQFLDYLAINVTYPEDLKNHCVEGELVVEILLSKDGKIRDAKIYKSLQNNFDQIVLSTLQNMDKINLDGAKYKGARRLRVPVSFKLR